MAQRSKFIGAPSRNEFWAPQEGGQSRPFEQHTLKLELELHTDAV